MPRHPKPAHERAIKLHVSFRSDQAVKLRTLVKRGLLSPVCQAAVDAMGRKRAMWPK